jgi:NADPH:quinone reductase-like Zn-dependent oxidoreductase
MKALIVAEKHQAMTVKEVPELKLEANQAIVQIKAAALNHRDLFIQQGRYAGLKYPIVLGSDGSGIVTDTGSVGDKSWVGREVIIYPSLYWGDSERHQDPNQFKILGLPDDGTFAEYVKVPVKNLFKKPAHLSFEEAAALPLAGLTAFRALFKRSMLQPAQQVLVTGIGGGVALFALQFAVAAGAQVYVTSGSDEKIQKALGMGAKEGINYNNNEWVAQLRQLTPGFDVIIDGAAGKSFDSLLDLANYGATLVLYGATMGNPTDITARRIFWKQLNVMGSTMGSESDFRDLITFVEHHSIRPVVDSVFAFEQGEKALQRMNDARQFGKIVITICS